MNVPLGLSRELVRLMREQRGDISVVVGGSVVASGDAKKLQ